MYIYMDIDTRISYYVYININMKKNLEGTRKIACKINTTMFRIDSLTFIYMCITCIYT